MHLLITLRTRAVDLKEAEHEVQLALDDLRNISLAIDGADQSIAAALAGLRERMMPRLESAGLNVIWSNRLAPEVSLGDASRVLHVLRILQEWLTNVVRHAAAASLHVETGCRPDGACIFMICDDGCGFDERRPVKGRGLANMRRRATLIDGDLVISSVAGGGSRLVLAVWPERTGQPASAHRTRKAQVRDGPKPADTLPVSPDRRVDDDWAHEAVIE